MLSKTGLLKLAAIVCLTAATAIPQDDADVRPILQTLAALRDYDLKGRLASRRIAFEFPEAAFNRYLASSLQKQPRPAIRNLTVRLLEDNRVVADVTIDFDSIKSWDPKIVPPEFLPLLKGVHVVRMDCRFQVSAAKVSLDVRPSPESEFPMPRAIFQDLIRATAAIQPEHLDLTAPIPLPFGLKTIRVGLQSVAGDTT